MAQVYIESLYLFIFFEITTSAIENSKDYTKGMRTLNK